MTHMYNPGEIRGLIGGHLGILILDTMVMVLEGHRFELIIEHFKSAKYIKGVLSTPPVRPVPVWMSYRAYRSVRYRCWCRTELTEVSGTGLGVVPN